MILHCWLKSSEDAESGTNVSSPADKDSIIDCAEKIRLTEMLSSESGSFTGEHFCQWDLQRKVNYRSLSAGDETLYILWS